MNSDTVNGSQTPNTAAQTAVEPPVKIFLMTPQSALLVTKEIPAGTTVGFLLNDYAKSQNNNANNYMLRVNRQPAHGDEVLKAGDRVSITPINGKGGC